MESTIIISWKEISIKTETLGAKYMFESLLFIFVCSALYPKKTEKSYLVWKTEDQLGKDWRRQTLSSNALYLASYRQAAATPSILDLDPPTPPYYYWSFKYLPAVVIIQICLLLPNLCLWNRFHFGCWMHVPQTCNRQSYLFGYYLVKITIVLQTWFKQYWRRKTGLQQNWVAVKVLKVKVMKGSVAERSKALV